MELFFFGSTHQRLFGAYHPPVGQRDRGSGIILCYPIGEEYMRSHRTFLHLAQGLTESGFHVLRFDYFGCGDSEGCFDECDFRRWADDVVTAVDEMRSGSGVSRVCLCGLRLGGTIAAMIDAERHGIDGLILWDPVVQGARYLDELRTNHRNWLRGSFAQPRSISRSASCEEILGYAITESLASSIREVDLLQLKERPAKRVVVLDTQGNSTVGALARHLQSLGSEAYHQLVSAPPVWVKQHDELENAMVPRTVISALVQCAELSCPAKSDQAAMN